MAEKLFTSEKELKVINTLVNKQVPSYRQAYSDRTAWVMACLSDLAYVRFNPIFKYNERGDIIEKITTIVEESKQAHFINFVTEIFDYDPEKEKEKLIDQLTYLDMKLVKTFNSNGTQAILVEGKKYLALVFRGTEKDNIKDIKTDAKANVVNCESGGKVHSGFKEAYELVALEIETFLSNSPFVEKPLLITGHSLGGALATVAAKRLLHQGGIAACYTFGSPRVGDREWVTNIKTPIYRLVNAADCVTMLPPGAETIAIIGWLLDLCPGFGGKLRTWLLSSFGDYLHCGNMRFLTHCPSNDYQNVKLLYSVSLLTRLKALIIKKAPWKSFLSDHSIEVYRKKLLRIAQSRN